jgi:hypothetical protein
LVERPEHLLGDLAQLVLRLAMLVLRTPYAIETLIETVGQAAHRASLALPADSRVGDAQAPSGHESDHSRRMIAGPQDRRSHQAEILGELNGSPSDLCQAHTSAARLRQVILKPRIFVVSQLRNRNEL